VEVTAQIDVADFSEQPGFDDLLSGVDEVRRALALSADLDDALVVAGGGEHGLAFADVPANGFLAIDVGAGFNCGDAMERVPMIGRTHQHDVEVLGVEHLAVVGVSAGPFSGFLALADKIGRSSEHVLVHVAERDYFHGRHLNEAAEVGLAIPSAADQADL